MEEPQFVDEDVIEEKPLVIIPREEWGAPPHPKELYSFDPDAVIHPVKDVIMTFTNTPVCNTNDECKKAMLTLREESLKQGLRDVPYNFVVGGDGVAYEGRGWARKPERNEKFPTLYGKSLEISHFGKKGILPTPAQIDGSFDLVLHGISKKFIESLPNRHSDFI